jgi:hypothetical protein
MGESTPAGEFGLKSVDCQAGEHSVFESSAVVIWAASDKSEMKFIAFRNNLHMSGALTP